jgi:RHS repeat-associated protein
LTCPSGREAEYTYEVRQLLKTIKWETAQIEDRSYHDARMLAGVDREFVDETRTSNAGSQLSQINNTNVGSQTYTYDLNGNVTSESLRWVMVKYSFSTIHAGRPFADGYDAEDRFMRFKRSGVTEDILLTRSNIGNISNVNRNGTNTARGYNTAHGLTTVTGGTTQTYDTDGNTTTLHTNVSAAWDDAGRMRNTNVPAGATVGIVGLNENGYVGGNRVWKKITRSGSVVEHRVHIHAGPNLIAEYNAGVAASTPVQEYVYAGEIDSLVLIRRSDATKYGVTRNRQWSITALHDLANGTIVERYAYEMTGKRTIYAANGTTVRTTSSYGNNFGYTNRWHDEDSGLMYFRARYYNPLTGEFLSRDPMEFVDGMSLYRGYFSISNVDPDGKNQRKVCCSFDDGKTLYSTTLYASKGVSAYARCKEYADYYKSKVLGAREGDCKNPERPLPDDPKPWNPTPPRKGWTYGGDKDCHCLVPTPPDGPDGDWDEDDDMHMCYRGCIKIHTPQPGWKGHGKMHECCDCCYDRHIQLCDGKDRTACFAAAIHWYQLCERSMNYPSFFFRFSIWRRRLRMAISFWERSSPRISSIVQRCFGWASSH